MYPVPMHVRVRRWVEEGTGDAENHCFVVDADQEDYVFGFSERYVTPEQAKAFLEELGFHVLE